MCEFSSQKMCGRKQARTSSASTTDHSPVPLEPTMSATFLVMSEPAQPSSVSVREATCEEVGDVRAGPALLGVGAGSDL